MPTAAPGRQRPHRHHRPLGRARRQRRRPDLLALSARRRRNRLASAEGQITDKAYSFDAALIPDGGYQVKVVASDSPSHTPGDALTGDKVSERFEIDTTPPVVTASGRPADAPAASMRLAPLRSQSHSTPRTLPRPSLTPSIHSMPARGSTSIPLASSPIRSASTTISDSRRRLPAKPANT